jgi:hypothetical protein
MNNFLDNLARTEVHIYNKPCSAFQVCGYSGLLLAIAFNLTMSVRLGLSILVILGLIPVVVLTFFGLLILTKIITGEEKIIYYHHEIAVTIAAAILLWLSGQPILRYLDLLVLGIGIFLACGRIGCLMVGCCHGRPCHWGVCYRKAHADNGFTPYYVGVRLFPVQALESIWVLTIVGIGALMALKNHVPGEALAWYVVAYDCGRFCFEFLRGDPERPYYWGFSGPQWISVILIFLVVIAELIGLVPYHSSHFVSAVVAAVIMISIALKRRFQTTPKHLLLNPRHIKEIAQALDSECELAPEKHVIGKGFSEPVELFVNSTSLGVQISAGKIYVNSGCIHHFTISDRNKLMSEESAKTLAGAILQMKHFDGSSEVIQRVSGVYHLLIHPPNRTQGLKLGEPVG